jgi:long-chain acyl-CoA synthetase
VVAQAATEIGFWRWAASDGDRVAVMEPDTRTVTYAELLTDSNRVAHGLRSLGLETGDCVAYLLGNQIEVYALVMAASQIGLYYTPINHHLVGDEVAYILADCGASTFVVGEQFADVGRAATEAASLARDRCFAVGNVAGFRPFDELTADQPPTLPTNRTAGNPMVYTSGTTGRPKGVAPTLAGVSPEDDAARRAIIATQIDIPNGDGVHLVQGPLYHSAPLGFSTTALHIGNTLVMMDKWSAENTLALCARYQVTNTQMVPTMFHRLLALPEDVRRSADVAAMRSVLHSAAPCPIEVKRRMIEWWGPILYEYYGGTEGGATMVDSHQWLEKPGTVGRPWPGTTLTILDDDGNECPADVPGTIYLKTPFGAPEYHNDPEKTAAVRHGDLFTLGDVGYLDDDGWLFLCDRKIDMIISGGVNIYPAEIEAVLLEHPKVGDAAVIGVPNTEWGEEVKAVVEPAAGVAPTPELASELVDFCREHLAKFKCPRTVDFRDQLPRYMSGKLYKRVLREEYWKDTGRAI